MNSKTLIIFFVKFLLLTILFLVVYFAAAFIFSPPASKIIEVEPGPISVTAGLLLVGATNTLVVMLALQQSRWNGWHLTLATIVSYYGAVTVMPHLETAFTLTNLTVSPPILRSLFLMGLPPALLFVPLAVWILGKFKRRKPDKKPNERLIMPAGQWVWKLVLLVFVYLILYLGAGYFFGWKNPALRAFYGGTDPGNFILQVRHILQTNPWLVPFQGMRALLWVAFVLPIIRMTRGRFWQVALLVAVLMSVPQNISQLLPTPFIPSNSVRISLMIETGFSSFLFGLIVTWLLYRKHNSLADLFKLLDEPSIKPSRPGKRSR